MYSLSLHAYVIPFSLHVTFSHFFSFDFSTDHVQKSATSLPEVLGDKEWGHSFSPRHTAFNRHSQFPGSLFEYFEGVSITSTASFP